ncbi:MAG: BACON domain-containing carbohydrate-binding protein [Odoribacter sp.]
MNFKLMCQIVLLSLLTLFIGCSDDNSSSPSLPDHPSMTISKPNVLLLSDKGTDKVEILSNVKWTSLKGSAASWLTVSPEGAEATSDLVVVTFTATDNTSPFERKAVVKFIQLNGSTVVDSVVVVQAPKLREPNRYRDSLALVSLYDATRGFDWRFKWNLEKPMETWTGVTLGAYKGELRVREIELSNRNLTGTLPAALENLTACTKFAIAVAFLEDQKLPDFFAGMPELTFLALVQCGVYGEIPESYYNKDWERLDLMDNGLSGRLSSKIGNWKKLKTLALSGNGFSGAIPEEIGGMESLQAIQLDNNQFTSLPQSIGDCKNLEYIHIGNNQLAGAIPSSIGKLQKLREIWLVQNKLNQPLPIELGNCTGLVDLGLSDNQISGVLPAFEKLVKLETFRMRRNQLTGEIPNSFATMKKLKNLVLDGNQLSGPIKGFLVNFEMLYLSNNQFSGALPAEFNSDKSGLLELYLNNNQLTGEFPQKLFKTPGLKDLNLDNNKFTGTLPVKSDDYGPALMELRLTNNKFSGEIPAALALTKELAFVCLSGNDFTGTIPGDFAANTKIGRLELSGNRLSGIIPQELLDCANWKNWSVEGRICPQQDGFVLSNCK